jgi:YVTN family beta-propeller protein
VEGRALALGIALALIMMVADLAPANAATVTNAWQAKIGSAGVNGTATIQAYTSGSGSIALKLAKLRASTYLPVTLSKGTCSSVGTTLIRFPAIKSTSTGTAARTSSLTVAQFTLLVKATTGTGRMALRVGSATTGGVKCAVFTALPIPAYVAATIPIGSGPEGPVVDANAAGAFVLSWTDGTVSRVDPAANLLTTFHLQITGKEGPDSIAYGEGALWVTTEGPTGNAPWAVQRLDPVTGEVVARIAVPGACGLTTSPDAVWVGAGHDGTIARIDPATNQVVATILAGENACDPQFAFGSLWAASDEASAIWRIDPATNKVVATVPVVVGPDDYFALRFAFGSVWAIDDEGDVLRIDPATNTVAATIATVGGPEDVESGAGSVWVSNWGTDGHPDGVLSRIDPATDKVIATIPVGTNPGDIAFAGGYVWIALQGEPILVQVNSATSKVQARINVGGTPSALAVTDHAVWVTVQAKSTDPSAPPLPGTLVRINF